MLPAPAKRTIIQSCELELLRQEGISPQLCIPPLISSPHSPPRPSLPRRSSSLPPTVSEAMDATSELSSPSWLSTPTLPPLRPSTPPATTASQPERLALLSLRPASLPLRQASPPPRVHLSRSAWNPCHLQCLNSELCRLRRQSACYLPAGEKFYAVLIINVPDRRCQILRIILVRRWVLGIWRGEGGERVEKGEVSLQAT